MHAFVRPEVSADLPCFIADVARPTAPMIERLFALTLFSQGDRVGRCRGVAQMLEMWPETSLSVSSSEVSIRPFTWKMARPAVY